ncbi:hypothetical protein C8R44DRAFT_740423 [Mycena epipterygia]|nr:hypothetical protein C8R44DRAFT_740423 [Mycena epipterygia]
MSMEWSLVELAFTVAGIIFSYVSNPSSALAHLGTLPPPLLNSLLHSRGQAMAIDDDRWSSGGARWSGRRRSVKQRLQSNAPSSSLDSIFNQYILVQTLKLSSNDSEYAHQLWAILLLTTNIKSLTGCRLSTGTIAVLYNLRVGACFNIHQPQSLRVVLHSIPPTQDTIRVDFRITSVPMEVSDE